MDWSLSRCLSTLFAILTYFGLLILSTASAEQNSLRGVISLQVLHGGEQTVVVSSTGVPSVGLDFNSTNTNVTNPVEVWRSLPDWLRYLSGCILLLVGIVITFFGVRFLHFSLFVLGGFIPAVITFGILGASIPNNNTDKTAIVYATSFSVWILAGIILICCVKLAVFVLGFSLGAVIALVLNPILLKYVWVAQPVANMVIWVVVFGIVGALLALCLERVLLIVSTSVGGAFGVVGSISAMAGTLNIASVDPSGGLTETTWQDWTGFAGVVGLSVFGTLIQLCCTAPGGDAGGYQKMD